MGSLCPLKQVNATGSGGAGDAERLFNALLRVGGVASAEAPLEPVRIIDLQGGGTASLRMFSQTNPTGATVEIRMPGDRPIKVRYD